MISFKIETAFAADGNKIRLPIAEVLLCAAAGDLARFKKHSITKWASDADSLSEADEANDDDSVVTIEAAEAKNPGKAKQASAKTAAAEMLATIADNCEDVLAFLQAVAVKYP